MSLKSILNVAAVCAAICSLSLVALGEEPAKIIADKGSPALLSGVLKSETRWGPPGFGETRKVDVKWTAWLLVLKHPTPFSHKNEDGKEIVEVLTRVQIGLESHDFDETLQRASGGPVIVAGKIWSASSQGDITSVVIWASSIKAGPNETGRQ